LASSGRSTAGAACFAGVGVAVAPVAVALLGGEVPVGGWCCLASPA
jgi:hypothetical protein